MAKRKLIPGDKRVGKDRSINETGNRYDRLTVIERAGKVGNNPSAVWLCQCDCGKTTTGTGPKLRSGAKRSCGCTTPSGRTAGLSLKHPRIYRIWLGMIHRCENPKVNSYKYYGGRGITVCEEWSERVFGPENFIQWVLTRDDYHESLSIDRIDNDGNYHPENCRWTDATTQANNTRRSIAKKKMLEDTKITAFGVTKSLAQWQDDNRFVVGLATALKRIKQGIPPETAISTHKTLRKGQDGVWRTSLMQPKH